MIGGWNSGYGVFFKKDRLNLSGILKRRGYLPFLNEVFIALMHFRPYNPECFGLKDKIMEAFNRYGQ